MLLNPSELPCLLIHVVHRRRFIFKKKKKKKHKNSNKITTRLAQGPAEEHSINRNINM